MPRMPEPEETTPEITGDDASMDEAAVGDAGNGADPYGEDLTGGPPKELEDDPGQPGDISTDSVERFPEAGPPPAESEEDLVTARPNEPKPPDPSELPF